MPYWTIDALKILTWAAVLYLLRGSDYNFFLFLIFLILSGYILFTPRRGFFVAHLILFILAPLSLSIFHSHLNIILAAAYFGVSLFILNLAKNPLFLFREFIYKIGFVAVFLPLSIVFFITGATQNFIFKELIIFLFAAFMFSEFLQESTILTLTPRKKALFSLIFGLIAAEFFWAVSLLPIGSINSSIFLVLVVYSIANFLLDHLKGVLNRKKILEHFTVFIILTLLIFASSQWTV